MFYLVQHIWFCLLLAAALGAFLMWLLRAWSKEETAGDLIIGWEARLNALRNENSQIKTQLQNASAKASLIAGLQADLNRQQKELTEALSQRDHGDALWMKKYGDLEAEFREKMTAMETQLATLRSEFSGLANERDLLATRLEESARMGMALEKEVADTQDQVQQWSARFANLEIESQESRVRLSAVTSEHDRLREAAKASAVDPAAQEELRRELAAAGQELASLRADIAKSHEIETEWREKWHEADAEQGRAQTELAALTARRQQIAAIESEKNRWQSEASALTDRIATLDAQSKEAQTRLAEVSSENKRLRDALEAPAGGMAAEVYEELRNKLAAAEQDTANLKSHLSTASFLQDEWRNKWHDAEAKYAAAQEQLVEVSKGTGSSSNLESENARLQSELASWASKYTLLRAEADLLISKVKALSDRLAVLDPTLQNPYEKADNGWRVK